jgi:aconitate hydratase
MKWLRPDRFPDPKPPNQTATTMALSVTQKIIRDHLVEGDPVPGAEIALRIDQTLTQDATGTMAYLQFEAMGVDRVKTDLSVSYVDHNTLQMGFRNPDDHRYLQSVAARYGIVFSPPGTGICHQLHLENFARPGATLIGSDSHTPTAGALGSMAMGAGGLSVALAMAGEPYVITCPRVVRVWLTGELTGWATAKDVILHILGELSVKGGVGRVMEYAGPGAATLTVPERATITNMGAELGATTSIFPADDQAREFLACMGRKEDFSELLADEDAAYDEEMTLDLSSLEPLAAAPHMPDRRIAVRELDGVKVDQSAIGSCTNSSYADLTAVARMLQGRRVRPGTDLMVSPGSRQVLSLLEEEGLLKPYIDSGARILECSCGPCIGMGGSPPSGGVSARTYNRNFEGRSATKDASVYLVSPQTAARAALDGAFTDPATWGEPPARAGLPESCPDIRHLFIHPPEDGSQVEVVRGPNIVPLSEFDPLPEILEARVLLKAGDDITTDHIMPAGAEITALRSNIPAISRHVFTRVDQDFPERADRADQGVIVAGGNYGQGSSREHAALAPRHLGVRAVLATSLARIHRANLVNFGILPLLFENPDDYGHLDQDETVTIPAAKIEPGRAVQATTSSGRTVSLTNDLTRGELDIIRAGGLLNHVKMKKS